MNVICIIGRITADPELRRTKQGTPVCSFTVAVDRPFSKDNTDFISCVAWNQSADYLTSYGSRGALVSVEGSLQGRKWTDKDGGKHTAWEIMANRVQLLSGRKDNQSTNDTDQAQNGAYTPPGRYQGASQGYGQQQSFAPIVEPDDELPF